MSEQVKSTRKTTAAATAAASTNRGVNHNTFGARKGKTIVTSVLSDVEVLQLDSEGEELLFSSDDLKVLNDTLVAELSEGNRERYLAARASASGERKRSVMPEITSPIADINEMRLALPERKGWHRTWLDGRFKEVWLEQGYRRLCKGADGRPVSESEATGSSRETYTITEVNPNTTKVQLVAVEIPEHVYLAHLEATELKDRSATEHAKEQFQRRVEDLNSRYGGHGKKLTAVVQEGEEAEHDMPGEEVVNG